MAQGTSTGTSTRAKAGAAAKAAAPRVRWATMPPLGAAGLAFEHDPTNRYRIVGADGKPRIFTGREMARVLEEYRGPAGMTAAAPAGGGSGSSGPKSRGAGK